MKVYICGNCGKLIIFRYNPPQIYHVGTGWDCWNQSQGKESARITIPRTTNTKERKSLTGKAKDLYQEYLNSEDKKPLKVFVSRMLRNHKGDVVHDLFSYIIDLDDDSGQDLIVELTETDAWKEYAEQLIKLNLKSNK